MNQLLPKGKERIKTGSRILDRCKQKINTKKNNRLYIYLIVLGILMVISAFFEFDDTSAKLQQLQDPTKVISEGKEKEENQNITAKTKENENEFVAASLPVVDKIINGEIRPNQTFWDILKLFNVYDLKIMHLIQKLGSVVDFNTIHTGVKYKAVMGMNNSLRSISFELDKDKIVTLEREDSDFVYKIDNIEYETRIEGISGTIDNSLFDAIVEKGEGPYLVSLFTDIFAWDIDFYNASRRGDTFNIILEKKYREGKFVKYGRVLVAEYLGYEGGLQARTYYFEDENNKGYYRSDGSAMKKQFLKSPLRYTRISSTYSFRRFHPILKVFRPHLGVDYAAPLGTPVRAVGDGRVVWAGYKGANGNLVIIKHNSTYTTTYAHLSRYGKDIKKGINVTQGQIIGYVGSTGRSTGPHLDFHVKNNGRSIDPLKLNLEATNSLTGNSLKQFKLVQAAMDNRLNLMKANTKFVAVN